MKDGMPARLLRAHLDEHRQRRNQDDHEEATGGKLRPGHREARSETAEDPEAT